MKLLLSIWSVGYLSKKLPSSRLCARGEIAFSLEQQHGFVCSRINILQSFCFCMRRLLGGYTVINGDEIQVATRAKVEIGVSACLIRPGRLIIHAT